jgi:hypothetical protein
MPQDVTLIRNHRSDAVIVTARSLGKNARSSVRDMVDAIAKMAGCALPVVDDGARFTATTELHVGPTAWCREHLPVADDLPVNGYRLYAGDGRVAINSSHDIGISNGIMDLLTDVLGVIWGMSHELFTDIPECTDIVIAAMDRTERPDFGFRVFSGADATWVRRNRIDPAGSVLPYYGHGHNLFSIVPPSKHADHPEYYSLLDGERQVPEEDGHTHIQPCLTNPDVIRLTVETVRAHFDANPDVTTYSLCPNDSDKFCECESCRALDDTMEQWRGRRMNSNSYFHYINAVATELLKTHPGRYVGVYAYWTTELLPHGLDGLPENVVVYLTLDSSQYFDPDYEARDMQSLEDWSKFAHHLAVYDYYGLSWYTPRLYTGTMSRFIPKLPGLNVKGLYTEVYPHWAHVGPQLFLATRLFWNTGVDTGEVLKGWCDRMFREVSDEMCEFYTTLEDGWMTRWKTGRWFLGLNNIYIHVISWDAAHREKAWAEIQKAAANAKSTVVQRRVNYVMQAHRVAYILSYCWETLESIRDGVGNLEDQAKRVLVSMNEAFSVFESHVRPDRSYGHTYYCGPRVEELLHKRWKGVAAMILKDALANDPALKEKLIAEDALFSELMEISGEPEWIKWIDETMREVPE